VSRAVDEGVGPEHPKRIPTAAVPMCAGLPWREAEGRGVPSNNADYRPCEGQRHDENRGCGRAEAVTKDEVRRPHSRESSRQH
jgi:hypothetical protein